MIPLDLPIDSYFTMSDSAILPSDQYYIRNQETFAGRNHVEDRSLNPKKVYCPTDGDLELASHLCSNPATLF